MLIILSPSKSLDFETHITTKNFTTPQFIDDSKKLISQLKKLSAQDLSKLMGISDKLASLNYRRFQDFKTPFTIKNSKPAIFVFDGDVYDAITPQNYSAADLKFAQNNLRILSGLYGILKPLDLIQPYRLEMGTSLKNSGGKNLYEFWQEKITASLNQDLKNQSQKIIINLASEEYFSAIDPKKINGEIINIIFKEKKGKDYKVIGLLAKRARGLMADFIIKNHLEKPLQIGQFNNGYQFQEKLSDKNNWYFYS